MTAARRLVAILAGETAGKVAEIAHKVDGAIGFTHKRSLRRLTRRFWSWRNREDTDLSHRAIISSRLPTAFRWRVSFGQGGFPG